MYNKNTDVKLKKRPSHRIQICFQDSSLRLIDQINGQNNDLYYCAVYIINKENISVSNPLNRIIHKRYFVFFLNTVPVKSFPDFIYASWLYTYHLPVLQEVSRLTLKYTLHQ